MRNTNGSTLAYSLLVIGVGVLFFIIHEQKDDLRNGTDYPTKLSLINDIKAEFRVISNLSISSPN